MSDLSPIGNSPVTAVRNRVVAGAPHANGTTERGRERTDRVEVSQHARMLERLRDLPSIRHDRVENVRNAIAEGRYETEDRLNVAIERLLDEISGG